MTERASGARYAPSLAAGQIVDRWAAGGLRCSIERLGVMWVRGVEWQSAESTIALFG